MRKEAAKRGVVVTELGTDWNRIMRLAPADTKLDERQRAMIELAKGAKATTAVKLMAGPPPAILEHALMKDANDPAASRDAGKITVALGDNTTKTIIRTSVDLKPDMCISCGMCSCTEVSQAMPNCSMLRGMMTPPGLRKRARASFRPYIARVADVSFARSSRSAASPCMR